MPENGIQLAASIDSVLGGNRLVTERLQFLCLDQGGNLVRRLGALVGVMSAIEQFVERLIVGRGFAPPLEAVNVGSARF